MIGPQLYIGPRRPTRARFHAPSNDGPATWVKPIGGLWTSTYDPVSGSGWVQFCLAANFGVPSDGWRAWLLHPEPSARLLRIDQLRDLTRALQHYGRASGFPLSPRALDFERLAADFDGVHLTDDGQWNTRLSHPYNLYGWDCESVLWLRWAFTRVEDLGVRHWERQEPPDD